MQRKCTCGMPMRWGHTINCEMVAITPEVIQKATESWLAYVESIKTSADKPATTSDSI